MSNDDITKNLPQGFNLILSRLDRLEQNVNTQFKEFGARLDGFESSLGSLDQKVEERLYDTRPMWEALNARLDDFEAEVKDRLKKVEFEMRGLKKGLGKAYMDVLMTQEEQEERINQLEQNLK